MINRLKYNLERAQHRMKQQADLHRSDRNFKVGDLVWLKLQPYRQTSVQQRINNKLSPKFYGPFQVLEVIGKVAYKLKLPSDSQVHNVFHVSQLKPVLGNLPVAANLPKWSKQQYPILKQPLAILDTRMVNVHNKAEVQYLIQWSDSASYENSWERAVVFVSQFPEFCNAAGLG